MHTCMFWVAVGHGNAHSNCKSMIVLYLNVNEMESCRSPTDLSIPLGSRPIIHWLIRVETVPVF